MRRVLDPCGNVSPPGREWGNVPSLEMIPRVPTRGARPGECAHCLFLALPQTPSAVPAKLTRNGRSLGAAGAEASGYRLEGSGLGERCSASRWNSQGDGWVVLAVALFPGLQSRGQRSRLAVRWSPCPADLCRLGGVVPTYTCAHTETRTHTRALQLGLLVDGKATFS